MRSVLLGAESIVFCKHVLGMCSSPDMFESCMHQKQQTVCAVAQCAQTILHGTLSVMHVLGAYRMVS